MISRAAIPRIALGAVLIIAVAAAFIYRGSIDAASLEAWLDGLGFWAPLVFMLLWAIYAPLFLPGSLLGLAGGALFGPFWGTLWNLTGATIGATIAFFISRYIASDWVKEKSGGRLKILLSGVEAEGWRFVAFIRLVPLFPFNLLNYALGLTRINPGVYIVTTFIAMLPGTFAYTYLGYAGREAIAGGEGVIQKALIALALLAAAAFLPRLIKRLRGQSLAWIGVDALKAKIDAGGDQTLVDVRGGNEFSGPSGHIPSSRNIPLGELPDRIEELRPMSEGPVILICKTDKRSAKAAQLLSASSFKDVVVLRGGVEAWRAREFEVSGRSVDGSMEPQEA